MTNLISKFFRSFQPGNLLPVIFLVFFFSFFTSQKLCGQIYVDNDASISVKNGAISSATTFTHENKIKSVDSENFKIKAENNKLVVKNLKADKQSEKLVKNVEISREKNAVIKKKEIVISSKPILVYTNSSSNSQFNSYHISDKTLLNVPSFKSEIKNSDHNSILNCQNFSWKIFTKSNYSSIKILNLKYSEFSSRPPPFYTA